MQTPTYSNGSIGAAVSFFSLSSNNSDLALVEKPASYHLSKAMSSSANLRRSKSYYTVCDINLLSFRDIPIHTHRLQKLEARPSS